MNERRERRVEAMRAQRDAVASTDPVERIAADVARLRFYVGLLVFLVVVGAAAAVLAAQNAG